MDQLKEFFGLVKRQHFWFVAPLVLILGIVAWFMGKGVIADETGKNLSAISTKFSTAQNVTTVRVEELGHPNETWHAEMEQLIASRTDNVKQAWQKKWDRQKELLVWPNQLPPALLRTVEPLRPIETTFDPAKDKISDVLLNRYAIYVKQELPKLAEQIGSKWSPATTGRSSSGSFEGEGRRRPGRESFGALEDDGSIVAWDSGNQGEIEEGFSWPADRPTAMQVLYAQEDLWVLSALMDIIAATNQGAIANTTAAVKEIQFIRLGKDAKGLKDTGYSVIRPQPLPSGEPGDDEGMLIDNSVGGTSSEPQPDRGVEGGEGVVAATPHPAEGRYVDDSFQPIADVATLKSSMDIAKRMPIRMRLKVDQRKLNRLLVACANAPLTVEVRQLRYNPQGDAGGLAGFGGGEGGRSFSSEYSGEGNRSNQGPKTKPVENVDTFVRTIEIYGIIYIFNPVNDQLLEGGADVAVMDDGAL